MLCDNTEGKDGLGVGERFKKGGHMSDISSHFSVD